MKTTRYPLIALLILGGALLQLGCIFDNDDDPPDTVTVRVYRVNAAAAGGDGSSWATAFKDIGSALQAAGAGAGAAEVWVAAGTYARTGKLEGSGFINMVSNTGLYGGFAGSETARNQRDWTANETILDGNGAVHVVSANLIEGGTLDGFTITGGNATETAIHGGGAYFSISSFVAAPTVRNCRFLDNHADSFGGGLYVNRNTEVVNCDFIGNTAVVGAGLFLHGGNNELSLVANCRFLGNGNDEDMNSGGGLTVWSAGETIIVNCLIVGNRADFGSGMSLTRLAATDTTIVSYCTFVGNASTLANGVAGLECSDSHALVSNSIFWDNREYYGPKESAQLRGNNLMIRYCTIDSLNVFAATGNNAGHPGFIDADGPDDVYGTLDDNLRLGGGSLAGGGDISLVPRDAGDLDGDGNRSERTPVNLAGEVRGATASRGAY